MFDLTTCPKLYFRLFIGDDEEGRVIKVKVINHGITIDSDGKLGYNCIITPILKKEQKAATTGDYWEAFHYVPIDLLGMNKFFV